MGTLNFRRRDRLPKSAFAIPEKAPEPGSYPIPDESHARNALARVSQHGTPTEKRRVRIAVARKYPQIGAHAKIIKVHDDGDLTVRQGKKHFVITMGRQVFRKVNRPRRSLTNLPRALKFTRHKTIHTRVGSHTALSRHHVGRRR